MEVTNEIIELVHKPWIRLQTMLYKELLNAKTFYELGVDILGSSQLLPRGTKCFQIRSIIDRHRLSYGRIYTTPANSVSVELLKTLVSNV